MPRAIVEILGGVDFPIFVTALSQGIFHAMVEATISQMEAYGELLAAAVKTVGNCAR